MRGFTLIEASIYLALLALLMSACMLLVASVFGSRENDSSRLRRIDDATFAFSKVSWAFGQARSATITDAGHNLVLRTVDEALDPINLRIAGDSLFMSEGDGEEAPLLHGVERALFERNGYSYALTLDFAHDSFAEIFMVP